MNYSRLNIFKHIDLNTYTELLQQICAATACITNIACKYFEYNEYESGIGRFPSKMYAPDILLHCTRSDYAKFIQTHKVYSSYIF